MHTPLRRPRARGSCSLGTASLADLSLTFIADTASADGPDASPSLQLFPAVDHNRALTILPVQIFPLTVSTGMQLIRSYLL